MSGHGLHLQFPDTIAAASGLSRAGQVLAGCVAAALAGAGQASAQNSDRSASVAARSGVTIITQSDIDCSIYGAGYVVVQGTTRCVRIRGRMRVGRPDTDYRGASYLPYAGTSGAELPANMQIRRGRSRWTR